MLYLAEVNFAVFSEKCIVSNMTGFDSNNKQATANDKPSKTFAKSRHQRGEMVKLKVSTRIRLQASQVI